MIKEDSMKDLHSEPEPATAVIKQILSPPAYTPQIGGDDDGDRERQWRDSLEGLKVAMATYDEAEKSKNGRAMEVSAADVVKIMRRLAATHTDPAVKKEWNDKANKFARAGKKERGIMSHDILKGLGILLASPFLLAGAAIFAAGAIIYGTGVFIKGLGDLMTFGRLSGTSKKSR